ncbi:MAG: TPM domain-containing protein [Burkholderiales bacterium]|nr:TPM domain-containing protein [Burkholderiales bacterium]
MSVIRPLRLLTGVLTPFVVLLLLVPLAWAQDLLPVPALTSHVIDTSGTLSQSQQQALDSKLTAFEAASGSQLVVLMVPTTQPEDIASYANRVGSAWKIGRKDIGDGLLLVVAKNDRKLRIEVARALEGAVPDLAAKRVIEQTITPRFKQGDFAGGLDAGVEQIMALIRGEALPEPTASDSRQQAGFQWMDLAVFLFFAVAISGKIVRGILGNKLGSLVTGGLAGGIALLVTSSIVVAVLAGLVAAVFTLISSISQFAPTRRGGRGWGGGGSGGGWSSGSGGGGGFSSGGGGGFGGGGASGNW